MNPEFRKRILLPSLIPIGAFVFIGALVFGFSRVLLIVTKEGSVVIGTLMAGCILFAAGALSKGGRLKDSQRLALVVFGVLVVGGGVAAGASLHTREVEGHIEVAAEITAQNTAFDKPEISLPAEEPTAILFRNNDPGIPHNVAIYETPQFTDPVVPPPPLFPGVAETTYEFEEGLDRGVYFFRCDAHPTQMTGQVLVGGATASPAPTPSPTTTGPGPAPTSPSPSPTPT